MADNKKPFHVIIIGGGLGGLALAQGLKKHGISCAVYEKDLSRADRLQGYRIFLRDFGTDGLKKCLPDDIYQSIKATAGGLGASMFMMKTEKLSPLMTVKWEFEGDYFPISRIVLHRLLATDLDAMIHCGYRFEKFETLDSGRIRVHFANGQSTEGDFLVGADGVHSAVRKQVFGDSVDPVKFGMDGVGGKIFLEDFEEPLKGIEFLEGGVCMVVGGNGRAMFLAPQIYDEKSKEEINKLFAGVEGVTHEAQLRPNVAGEEIMSVGTKDQKTLVDDARDYVFWAYLTTKSHEDFSGGVKGSVASGKSQKDLVDDVLKQMQKHHWNSDLIDMVMKTDINTVGFWPLRLSPEIKNFSQRKPSNLTFIGDSIHAMPPTGGEGGNTALRDAALLLESLTKVASSSDRESILKTEIPMYEKDMLQFARTAVNRSYRNAKMAGADGYIKPYVLRIIMRTVNFFFGLKK